MKKLIILITIISICIYVWISVLHEINRKDLLVTFLDVEQGDAIFIEAPNGNQFLIDVGLHKQIMLALEKVIPLYDTKINGVLLTHFDSDHAGGVIPLQERYFVNKFYFASSTGFTKDDPTTLAVLDSITNNKDNYNYINTGDRLIIDSVNNIYLDILHPNIDFISDDTNSNSVIAKLVYKNTCFIFSGDAPKEIEEKIVKSYEQELDCDVLKVGHHGSKTSTNKEFVGFVSPEYAVISYGENNKFGHPHEDVISVLEEFEVVIKKTAESGNVSFKSDGFKVEEII